MSKKAALAQSKLQQAKGRQRRHSSIVSTEFDKWSNSDTVEVINLVSDSPQHSPITIVTSSSPKEFKNTKNKGHGSVEKIVQKLQVNREQIQRNKTGPNRDTSQTSQATANTAAEPIRATQQAPHLTTITKPDSSLTANNNIPVTIMIESDNDNNNLPEDPILEDDHAHQEPPPKESTRIDNNEINISKEHSLSEDERSKLQEEQTDSPRSICTTAPSEIPLGIAQEQSPISSLDPEEIDQLNTIFDN